MHLSNKVDKHLTPISLVYFEKSRGRPLLVGNTHRAFSGEMKPAPQSEANTNINVKNENHTNRNMNSFLCANTNKNQNSGVRQDRGRVGEMKQRSERPQ